MRGTEKQIIWATKIQSNLITMLESLIKQQNKLLIRYPDPEEVADTNKELARLAQAKEFISNVESAEYLIDYFKNYSELLTLEKFKSQHTAFKNDDEANTYFIAQFRYIAGAAYSEIQRTQKTADRY
jgi:predicted Zn-dependent peptidase